MKRITAAAAVIAVVFALLPGAFSALAAQEDDGYFEIHEYDLFAEAVGIGLLLPDGSLNPAFEPPLAPTGDSPAGEAETTEPLTEPEEEEASRQGLAALAEVLGLSEKEFYFDLKQAAASGRFMNFPLSEIVDASHGSVKETKETKIYSRHFDYYDSAGKKLWSAALAAVYRVSSNSSVCMEAVPYFRSYDDRWRSDGPEIARISRSGSSAQGVFTIVKYLGVVKTATVERTLTLFATPQGVYRDDPSRIRKGDVNRNGKIDAADARTALRCASHIDAPTAEEFIAADCNADGTVASADALKILRTAARLS